MDAIRIQRLAHKLFLKRIPFLPSLLMRWIHFRYNSDLSAITEIGEGTKLGHGGIGVVIHPKAKIGRNCIIAQNVTIAGKNGERPVIKDWVYLGHASIVMGGVTIGDNAVVGALTLVNKDVPDNAVVGGIPAKVLRWRTEDDIKKWHEWVIKNNGLSSENA